MLWDAQFVGTVVRDTPYGQYRIAVCRGYVMLGKSGMNRIANTRHLNSGERGPENGLTRTVWIVLRVRLLWIPTTTDFWMKKLNSTKGMGEVK